MAPIRDPSTGPRFLLVDDDRRLYARAFRSGEQAIPFWGNMERYGDQIALIAGEQLITYAELAAAADSLTAMRNDLILLELDQSIAAIAAYIGALRRGAAAIVINAGDPIAAERMLASFKPSLRWSPERALERVARDGPATHPDLAVMLSTSGTTGATKLARLSAAALDANAQAIVIYLGIDQNDRAITTLPLGYSYGLSVLNSHLAAGASIVLNKESVTHPDFRRLVDEHGVTNFAGVPYTYELLERVGFFSQLPPSIAHMTQAGGQLPEERVRSIGASAAAHGARFFVMYGQTEATARMAYLPPDQLARHPGCIGRPIPGGHFSLVDPHAGTPHETRGELVYTGPNIMMGYAEGADDLVRGRELDCLYTGDLAERVASDLYRLTGRKSRFIKLVGLRISLDELEREAISMGWRIIATGMDEYLVLASEQTADGGAVVAAVVERYGIPRQKVAFVALNDVPRLASGKTDYAAIIRASLDADANIAQVKYADAEHALCDLYRRNFPQRAVSVNDSFLSLNGDSLSYIIVSLGIEEFTGTLPDRWESLSIAELARRVRPAHGRNWSWVETSVAARALAPIMVVANHAGVTSLRGGAALLLIIAGLNFGRFSGGDLISQTYSRIAKKLLLNILLPYWLVLIAISLIVHGVSAADFMLVNNFLQEPSNSFETWFVEVTIQSIILLSIFTLIPPFRRMLAEKTFTGAMTLLLLGIAVAAAHRMWLQDVLNGGGRELSWQFGLFALGFAANYAERGWRRGLVMAGSVCLSLILYRADHSRLVAVLAGTFLLLWVPKVPLPTGLTPLITLIGSSSMFIYMVHGRAPVDSLTSSWPVDILRIVTGVCLGVITWFVYEAVVKSVRLAFIHRSPFRTAR